jgi:hypothetical protein
MGGGTTTTRCGQDRRLYRDRRYQQGIEVADQVLKLSERNPGRDLPDTATSLSEPRGAVRIDGQFDKALRLYQRALAIKKKARRADHSAGVTISAPPSGGS